MENQRIELLHQIQTLETEDILGPEDAAVISHLKKKYNETVETIYQNTPGLFWDIIEVFPEDIWIQIIQEALPTYRYAAALLTLTTVSSKWLQVLTSTPILWAYVEICGSDEDSLATVGVFAHLSRQAPLAVIIYLPFGHDATTLLSMLATVGERIQRIALATDKRVHGDLHLYRIPEETYYAGIRFLIDAVKHTPNVSVIDVEEVGYRRGHPEPVIEMASGLLSPSLRAIYGYCFCRREKLEHLLHLQELNTCGDPSELIPGLERMAQLRRLTLVSPWTEDPETKPGNLIKSFPSFSKLTSLSLNGRFRPNWLNLLTAVAPDLVDLELLFPLGQFSAIINILQTCGKLRTLNLDTLYGSDVVSKVAPVSSISGLMNLRSLRLAGFVSYDARDDDGRPMHLEQLSSIITSITELARRVEQASIFLDLAKEEHFTHHVLECISKLRNLKRLNFFGLGWPITLNHRHVATLQRLEELETLSPEAFGALSLLSIIWKSGVSDHISLPGYDNVRTLHIQGRDHSHWTRFPQNSLPHLIKLKLTLHNDQHLQLGSFLLLTSISIRFKPGGATSLCIALLYKPEDCPCLSDIEFLHSSPEWDILFIMLERRNFLATHSISRIRRISLPFISNGLRAPLARLLRGIYGNRPSNQDLSFEGVIELVFNKQIPGCLSCLRNMLGPCNEPIVLLGDEMDLDPLDLSIYSTVDNPPPLDLDSAIVDWINRREMYGLSWKSAAEDLIEQRWRKAICNKQVDARVEITEHDVPVEW